MHIMNTHSRDIASSRKRATNVSLREGLLEEAKALGVNVSSACETGLEAQVREARAARWLSDNRAALEAWNDHVDKQGLPLRRHRQF
jgi:antitoxin CcdA